MSCNVEVWDFGVTGLINGSAAFFIGGMRVSNRASVASSHSRPSAMLSGPLPSPTTQVPGLWVRLIRASARMWRMSVSAHSSSIVLLGVPNPPGEDSSQPHVREIYGVCHIDLMVALE